MRRNQRGTCTTNMAHIRTNAMQIQLARRAMMKLMKHWAWLVLCGKRSLFRDAEKTLNRGITTLLMNLATLVSNMDVISTLADSMRIPRQVTSLLVSVYKPVMVTELQMYTLCSYHMLVVWYWSGTTG